MLSTKQAGRPVHIVETRRCSQPGPAGWRTLVLYGLARCSVFIDPFNMRPAFFTESEARAHVGERLEALSDFPSVPAGTSGKVVRARRVDSDDWVVCVEWTIPRKRSLYFATIVNISFNFETQSNPLTDEFSKDEFERLVGCRHPSEN